MAMSERIAALLILVTALLVQVTVGQAVAQPVPCLRWAHQSTLAQNQAGDGHSIWIYGGRARTSIGQAENTWTNTLLKLDLDQPFSIAGPPLEVVQSDNDNSNAPPKVALGALVSNSDGSSLYQYFGQFSDTPPADPTANELWQYSIHDHQWSTVQTTGDNIDRVAEGAGALAPSVGTNGEPVAFYFGGHEDLFTLQDYDGPRVFLSSMTAIDLGSNAWKNMTTFASSGDSGSRNSTNATVPPILRADSTLTYVPNLGTDNKGVLVAIGGGNEYQMIENTILDVYDIGAGAFVKQATQGDIMKPRVNHCAVRGSAMVNGQEQHQIFIYGGHASNRTTQIQEGQDTDVYMLSLPSYTWTYVGNNITSQPVARAGHTCELIGDQMISIGGYISDDYVCEQPGVYVLNTTSLEWQTEYTPGTSFQTPLMLQSLLGGSGTSNSTGGSGWTNPNNNYTATVTKDGGIPTSTTLSTSSPSGAAPSRTSDADLQNSSSSSRIGSIVGGVAGALCLLFLVAFLVNYFAKRQRRRERDLWSRRLLRQDGYTWTADDDEEGSALVSMPYNDMLTGATGGRHDGPQRPMASVAMRASGSLDSSMGSAQWSSSHPPASDNVESDTEGMQVSGLTHLAPRETLRVTNPSNRSRSSLGYSTTQRSS